MYTFTYTRKGIHRYMYMYVCMFMYMYMCLYVYLYLYMYTYICICIHICMYGYMSIYVDALIETFAETANIVYCLLFAERENKLPFFVTENKRKVAVSVFCLRQTNRSCHFPLAPFSAYIETAALMWWWQSIVD